MSPTCTRSVSCRPILIVLLLLGIGTLSLAIPGRAESSQDDASTATEAPDADTADADSPDATSPATEPATEPPDTEPPDTEPADTEPADTEPADTETPAAAPTVAEPPQPESQPESQPEPSPTVEDADAPEQPRLRFNFRYQRWVDVLDWFAEQADLSLVLDAPPPGTFNYTDTREYTPVEAIDLLNSVLLTKGYTLIRRDRMLLLIDLKEGVPEGMVPRLELDELDDHGKFELVSMLFSLGRRPATVVQTEINALLGPYGKVVSLPATKQVLVTDTTNVMRAIGKIIELVAELPATATDGELLPPVLEVYAIRPADPKVALDVLATMTPTAKLVYDEKTDQLHVHAPPSHQAVIRGVLDQMQLANGSGSQRLLEVYPVAEDSAEEILATLETVAPGARITLNKKTSTLAVWCSASEQESIKQAIEKLHAGQSPIRSMQLEVHRLGERIDPDTTLALLKNLLPNARLSVDPNSRMIIAVAIAADQEVIRKTMVRLVPDRSEKYPEAQFYPLAHASPSMVVEVIKKSVPKAMVAMEASGNRLMVVASDYEHTQIAEIVQKMEREVFVKGQNKLVVYPVTLAQRTRFEAVLDTLKSELPGTRVIEGAEPGELAVWARPRQHEVLVEILEELKREVPNDEKFGLIAYPTYTSEPADIIEALQNVFPDTKLIADEPNRRLLAWTYPTQHEALKQALEQLLPQQAATGTRVLRAYPFPYAADQPAPAALSSPAYRSSRYSTPPPAPSPSSPESDGLLAALKQLVPQAELSLDAKNELLIALATPEDHEVLQATLERIEAEIPGKEKPQLEVYAIADSNAAELLPLLQPLVPEAQLSIHPESGNLLAFATSDDHAQLKTALEKLDESLNLEDTPQLQVYHLSEADPQSALNLLQNLVPKARITIDAEHDVLVAIARLSDQAVIKAALDELESILPAEKPRFDVYDIGNADTQKLLASLQPMVPDARLTVDLKTESLFAWCTETEHAMLADVLAKLLPGGLDSEEPVLRVYPFPYVTEASSATRTKPSKNRATELPTSLVTTLQQVAPDAKITIDNPNERLIVMASPTDHMQIVGALAQLETEPPVEPQLRLATYQLESADIDAVETMIGSLFPDCHMVVDKRANRLSVWADTDEQQAIGEAVEQMDTGIPVDRQEKVMVYPISKADPTVAIGILQELLPDVKLQADATAGTIVAWARAEDHETIRQVVEKMQAPEDEQGKPRLVVYPLKYTDVDTVSDVLRDVLPDTDVTEDEAESRLIVLASPADHTVIEGVIEQMDVEDPADAAATVMVHEIEAGGSHSTAYYMLRLLREVAPRAAMTIGSNANQLIIRATPEDHATIGDVIEKLNGDGSPETAPKVVVYPLMYTDTDTVSDVLRDAVPEARVTEDEETNKLIAWASPADQTVIAEVIKQMDVESSTENAPTMMIYELAPGDSKYTAYYMFRLLRDAVPSASFSTGTDSSQLIVWARPEGHATVSQIIEKFNDSGSPENAPKVVVYPLKYTDTDTVSDVLRDAVPDAEVTEDEEANKLIAWARPDDHTVIAEIVKQMDVEGLSDDGLTAVVYTLDYVDVDTVRDVLTAAVPDAQLTDDDEANRLIAWARPADQTVIAEVIKQMDVEDPADATATVMVHEIEAGGSRTTAYYMMRLLREVVPQASMTIGSDANQLIVWASPEDHTAIGDVIEKLNGDGSPENAPKVVVYPLKYTDTDTVSDVLRDAVPDAEVTEDEEANKLIAWARPDDHTVIAEVVKQMDVETPAEDAPTMMIYTLETGDSQYTGYYMMRLLRDAVPEASFSTGSDPSQLIVWASPEDQTTVGQLIEKLNGDGSPENAPKVVVYPLQYADVDTVSDVLRDAVPDAEVTEDEEANKLIAWARPDDHTVIAEVVKQMDVPEDPATAATVTVYTLSSADLRSAIYAIRLLREATPEATFTLGDDPSQLVTWARPADHEVIEVLIEKLASKGPPELAPKVVVYALKYASVDVVENAIRDAVPDAETTDDEETNKLIVWALPEEHKTIEQIVEQVDIEAPADSAPTAAVYALKHASVEIVAKAVTEALPEVQVTDDEETNKLIVWARPDEHKTIEQIVEQIDIEAPADSAPTAVVYTFESASPAGALEILQTAIPKGTFAVDENDPQRLIALARAAEQVIVAEIVSRIDVEPPAGSKPTAAVYTLNSSDARRTLYVIRLLQQAAPDGTFTLGSDLSQIIAWAKPSDQEMIQNIVEKLIERPSPETLPHLVTYRLPSTGAAGAVEILAAALPEAQLTVGPDPSQLIVFARPSEHETIKASVEQMEADGFADANRTLAVYPMKSEDAASLMDVLDPSLIEGAKIVADASRDSLLVWADAERQAAIKKVVEQFLAELPEVIEPASHVYRLRRADPTAAQAVLSVLVPEAEIALDEFNRSLIIGALPEDHEKIRAMIDEMDREDALRDPQLKVHVLTSANPANMLVTLQSLFAKYPEVQLSLDELNGAVIAVATPDEQKTIGQLIQQVEEGILADADAEFKLYPLKDVDTYVLMEVLTLLAEKQGAKIKLTLDNVGNQLIAIARPEHHALIAQTIEDLRTEERSLEVFQLDYNEPRTAILAIGSLFRDDGAIGPYVDSDAESGQLFVRATKDQLIRIRQLLVKMGETNLGSMQLGSGSRLRVIPIQGDPKALLEELRRVWPQLRGNPIQVQQQPPEDRTPEPNVEGKLSVEGANGPAGPAGQSGSEPSGEVTSEETGDEALPPIVVMLGEASMTVASEDLAALDQFEALLHSLAGRTGIVGRYFSIFKIEHTGAAQIAATLTALFRTNSTTSNGSSRWQPSGYRSANTNTRRVVIVPDERLNTILVQGSRPDRAKVEDLLKVLDVPGGLANKPQFIRIENTDASRVAKVVREMFQSRLASSSSSSSSRSGTTLSRIRPQLIVDELSNSLIVMAPSPLVDDITEFARSLDESAAEEPARGIRIISLKKIGADRVEQVLGAILGRGGGSRAMSTPKRR